MNKLNRLSAKILCGIAAIATALCGGSTGVFADSQFSVSPMNQRVILTPGETYTGSFIISNPMDNTSDFKYKITTGPIYIDNDYNVVYENNGDMNQIVDWTVLDNDEGVLAPNATKEITFRVDVPTNAPAGGQYLAISVASADDSSARGDLNIQSKYAIAHIVYAEVAGTTVRKGEVVSASVPGFMLGGKISGNSTIKNTGNVHSDAKYTLQVFPLFSSEEIYTNEEDPETKIILPDRSLYNVTSWEETPSMGIFNVIYTAEFEGVTTEVKKMVIICPLWLLIVILVAICALILWIFTKSRSRKKSRK